MRELHIQTVTIDCFLPCLVPCHWIEISFDLLGQPSSFLITCVLLPLLLPKVTLFFFFAGDLKRL